MATEAGPRWTAAGLRPYAEVVLDAFGPARVMFGSDWPVCLLAASYADVTSAAQELTAALTREEQALIFGGTAARIYRLPDCIRSGTRPG
jgi:L-fuconolactonase